MVNAVPVWRNDANAEVYTDILHVPLSEDEIVELLDIAQMHERQGRYKSAETVVADMRIKYGI